MTRAQRAYRRARAFAAVLVLLLLPALAGCGTRDLNAEQAIGARPGGRILFAQHGDIYLWDGSVRQVTQLGDASAPSWSPDGRRFAFVRTGYAISDIYVTAIDGGDLQQLTFNQPDLQPGTEAYACAAAWAVDPSWSPSSDAIVFATDMGAACPGSRPMSVWIVNGSSGGPVPVYGAAVNGDNAEDPTFSPDGSKVVFAQRMRGENDTARWTELWVTDLEQGAATPLVQGQDASYDPAWSPDGRWIAFVRRVGGANDLWVVPATGGEPVRLTDGRNVASPAWSPDGKAIAFIDAEGSALTVRYVSIQVDAGGVPSAGNAEDLFEASDIDTPSGLSWAR